MHKTKVLLWAVVAIWILLASVGFAFENEPEGFRGLKWGDPPTKDMVLMGTEPWGESDYRKIDDKMSMGDVPLVYVLYTFFNNQFMDVLMQYESKGNYNILAFICQERFGEPTMREIYDMTWTGESEGGARLTYDPIKDSGSLMLANGQLALECLAVQMEYQRDTAEGDW